MDRLHRTIRRQLQRLRDAGPGRTAEAVDVLSGRRGAAQRSHGHPQRSRHLVSGQQAHSVSLAPRCLERMDQASVQREHRWRLARTVAGRPGRPHLVFSRRHEDRLQPDLPQLPHLEALHRRTGAGHLHLRSQEQYCRRRAAHRLDRHLSHVARQHHLFHLRSRRRSITSISTATT